jgi:hypothetical protein
MHNFLLWSRVAQMLGYFCKFHNLGPMKTIAQGPNLPNLVTLFAAQTVFFSATFCDRALN